MSECYDCGELFDGFCDCPKCGSENVGLVDHELDDDDFVDDIDEEYE